MGKALPGENYCINHQGNHSHYDPKNCTVCRLRTKVDQLRVEAKRTCLWTNNKFDLYYTECGHVFEFISGGPTENKATYCQYCGGKIWEVDQ